MKQFLKRLVIFFIIFFIIDKCFIVVRNVSAGFEADKRLEQIINKQIDAKILVFGSSRGARNVIAQQITDSLGKKAFNLSYPGSNIEFHDYLLEQTLKFNPKPETVILVVDGAFELPELASIKFRYDRLFPLVKYEPVRETLVEKGIKNKVMMKLFVLHQLNLNNFLVYKKKFSSIDTVFNDGSMPVSFQSPKFSGYYDATTHNYSIASEDKIKLAAFISFIDRCNKNNIQLILAFPPNYFHSPQASSDRLESLAAGKASFMFYDSSRKEFRDPAYYFDYSHLTRKGAVIFTEEIISFLKKH